MDGEKGINMFRTRVLPVLFLAAYSFDASDDGTAQSDVGC